MQLYLQGSPLVEMTAKKSDGTILFIVETHPYLEDQRTEVYDAEGDVLGSIIWNGTQPSHICVYSESASQAQAFEMVPRGDPTAQERFEVVAGDGAHEILWVVDRAGLQAHYPMPSRSSSQRPPLIASFIPRRGNKGGSSALTSLAMKRKLSESDCDTLELAVEQLSDDALGRFWVAFVLLDIIRKSKFRIPDEPLARLQTQNSSNGRLAVPHSPTSPSSPSSRFPRLADTKWRVRTGTEKLKELTVGLMLQPRRWSL